MKADYSPLIKAALEVLLDIARDEIASSSDRIEAAKLLISYCVDADRYNRDGEKIKRQTEKEDSR